MLLLYILKWTVLLCPGDLSVKIQINRYFSALNFYILFKITYCLG